MTELPPGFSDRLRRNLSAGVNGRRSFLGWMVTAATAAMLAAVFEAGRFFGSSQRTLRSEHAQSGTGVPPDMTVAVSTEGKTFHAPGCRFIHDKDFQKIAASEAIRQGYAPCVRCMKEFLRA